MTVAADLLLVHVGQQEVLRLGHMVGRAGVQVTEVVGERADIVVVILGPAGEVRAAELAARPRNAERRLVGALALDGFFKRLAEFVSIHQFGHLFAPYPGGNAVRGTRPCGSNSRQ
jgi:hypothetical protein